MRRQPEDHGLHPDGKSNAEVAQGEGRAAATDLASSLTRHQAMRTPAFYLAALAFGLGVLNVQVVLIQTIAYLTRAGYQPGFAALMITVTSIPATLLKRVGSYDGAFFAVGVLTFVGGLIMLVVRRPART